MAETHDTSADVPLGMARAHLEAIPQFTPPPGYRLRGYAAGDVVTWTSIQRVADTLNTIDAGLFGRQYGSAPDALAERMLFVTTGEGEDVGTISAWWEHGTRTCVPGDRGRVHWLAVRPDHQRRGLAKALMTRALTVMARHHASAMLDTSSGRPWAARLYLDFGFLPEPSDLEDVARRAAWRAVQGVIDHPRLGACLAEAP